MDGTWELDVQRKLTDVFIMTQPVILALQPRAKTRTSSGGVSLVGQTDREPQTMRLIEPGDIPLPTVTLDGVQREVTFELLGKWDSEIGVYDTFSHDGQYWEVVALAHFNGWEKRALVSKRGQDVI